MVVGRSGRNILGFDYENFVMAMDWNRVLIQAQGLHMYDHDGNGVATCGYCIRNVLLMSED